MIMSRSRSRSKLVTLVWLSVLGGCLSDVPGGEQVGTKGEPVTTALPATGFVPYPVRLNASGQPITSPSGDPIPAWDGSLADLLSADALAFCGAGYRSAGEESSDLDRYLRNLQDLMAGAYCEPQAGSQPGATIAERWKNQRTNPDLAECNVNTSTLDPAVVSNTVDLDSAARYTLPPRAQLNVQPGGGGTEQSVIDAIDETQKEVRVAQVNACMAIQLREKLITADVLLASGRDQLELLEVIRQRAQVALHYYTLLGLSFANIDTRPDLVAVKQQILPVLRAWRRASSAEPFGDLGSDFAQVTRVYIQTVTELARLLARRAGASGDDSDLTAVSHRGATRADRRWGNGAWRNRLHNLLYGGDPLGTGFGLDSTESFNHVWGTYGGYATKPYVSTEVDEPEVNVLLGLARSADSLYLAPGRLTENVASFIYRDVEAWLLEQQCLREDPLAPCAFDVASAEVPSLSAFEDSLLWQTFRVTPDHARKLAAILVEAAPTVGNYNPPSPSVDQHGAFHLVGHNERVDAPPGVAPAAGAYWAHIDPQFSMVPFDNATYGSAFGSLVGTAIPSTLYLYQPGTTQGFVARRGNGEYGGSNLDVRYTGAVSVLAAVRDGLLTGREWAANAGSPSAQAYYKHSEEMLGAITATAGETSVAVKPYKIPLTIQGTCSEYGGVSPCVGLAQLYLGGGAGTELLVNEVSVVVPKGTAPADLVVLNTGSDASLTGIQTSAALYQEYRSFDGYTRADLDAESAIAPTVETFANSAGAYDRWTYLVGWPRTPNQGQGRLQAPTLLLRTRGGGGSQYLILADQLEVRSLKTSERIVIGSQTYDTYRSSKGRYLAFGGTLGDIAQRSRVVLRDNWSVPALDGFGLPIGWVPPTSPELTGISAGDTAVNYYLRTSKVAAEEATRAVESAVENLIAEEGDQQVLSAAEEKGEEVPELEKRAICGQAKNCSVPAIAAFVPAPSIPCSSAYCNQADELLDNLLPKQVVTSVPLLSVLDAQAAPKFPEFAGGAIQGALIREWTAHSALNNYIRAIGGQVEVFDLKVQAAEAQLGAARASSDAARERAGRECSEDAFNTALKAGYSFGGASADITTYQNDDGYVVSAGVKGSYKKGATWSYGPFLAQEGICKAARDNLPPSAAVEYAQDRQSAATMTEAMAWLGAQAGTVGQLVGDAAGARAEVSRLLVQGKNAERVAELDGALAQAGRTRTFGTYRRLHQYDLWRARALLENARRLAATARRAIESQYVVNLSTLLQDEPFVSSPESWADEVYDFDLDAPSAVGLSSVPTRNAGIYPNKLLDYVSNLEAFVQGYSVARPSTVALRDAEIFSLTGPDTLKQIEVDVGGETQVLNVLDPDSQGWQFYCPDSDSWATHPSVGEVPASFNAASSCGDGKRPTMARRLFHLDPWGRLSGLTSNPPYQARYNARWKRLAVNLVGTGIRDCSRADDPLSCYSESFIRYDLRHVGPSWVTDYNQHWRWLGVGSARIEAGKAITAEEWLDPLVNGWSQAFVSEAARTEFMDRPLDGDYGLTLHLTPDIRMERIDRIQILLETSYWVGSE